MMLDACTRLACFKGLVRVLRRKSAWPTVLAGAGRAGSTSRPGMVEIVRHAHPRVERWPDGSICSGWTTEGIVVPEQRFRRIIGYACPVNLTGLFGPSGYVTDGTTLLSPITGLTGTASAGAHGGVPAIREPTSWLAPIHPRIGCWHGSGVYPAVAGDGYGTDKACGDPASSAGPVSPAGSGVAPAPKSVESLASEVHDIGLLALDTLISAFTGVAVSAAARGHRHYCRGQNTVEGLRLAVATIVARLSLGLLHYDKPRRLRHGRLPPRCTAISHPGARAAASVGRP